MCIVAMIQCGIPVRTMLYSVTDRLDFWLSSSVLVYRSWMLALRGLNVHTAGYWIQDTSKLDTEYIKLGTGYIKLDTGYIKVGYGIHQAGYIGTVWMIHQNWIRYIKRDTWYIETDTWYIETGWMIRQSWIQHIKRDTWYIELDDTAKLYTWYSELNKCYVKSEGSTLPSDLLKTRWLWLRMKNKARNDWSVDIQFFIVTFFTMSCWRQQIHKLRKLASRTETQLERTSEMSRGNAVSSSYNANLSTANKQ